MTLGAYKGMWNKQLECSYALLVAGFGGDLFIAF